MTNNKLFALLRIMRVVNRFQKMYLCYDEQPMKNLTIYRVVVNRFQKMYLCYDEQLPQRAKRCACGCESLSKNVSLL